jgi:hypothetical protein
MMQLKLEIGYQMYRWVKLYGHFFKFRKPPDDNEIYAARNIGLSIVG